MRIGKSTVFGAAMLIGTAIAAQAQQAAYPPYAYYPYGQGGYYQAPAMPPAWNYNPYTSGLGACLNWLPGDLPCRERTLPTFGQPNYQPIR
jgi:hypothetical protein